MARPRSVDVDHVLRCARRAFARAGLRRTLMADIAKAAGVSAGTLYNIASSKEALFLAVFLPPERLQERPLPLATPSASELLAEITDSLQAATALPLLSAASRRPRAQDAREELSALVGERYDAIAGSWELLAAVEQTARDFPIAAERYYGQGRQGQAKALAVYLKRRGEAGQLRDVNPHLASRYVIETVAWWAWHRHEDADPPAVTDAQARALVQDLVAASLLPRPR
jgi:AcrR family transcriptional regulator